MPRFLLDSTKRASRRGLLGKLENIAVYLILFFLCFAAVILAFPANGQLQGKEIQVISAFLAGGDIAVLCVLWRLKRLDPKTLMFLLFLLGVLMRLSYAAAYPAEDRQHDVFDADGHLQYILRLADTWRLPDSNNWQYNHPPLHHLLAAVWVKVFQWFGVTDQAQLAETLQFLTCFYSCAMLAVVYRIFDENPFGRRAVPLAYALVCLHPTFYLLRDLIGAMGPAAPEKVKEVAEGLVYRDFMTVGLLLDSLKLKDPKAENGRVMDDWIYVQERDVKIGRLQLFNNWSPYMVKDPDTVFMGLEYFCDEGDEMWNTPDQEFIDFAVGELEKLGIVERSHVKDAVLIRVPKAYPAYFGTYGQFGEIRKFTDSLENLFLLGRNGQHRYNNMDHSMLTAMAAAEAILSGNVRDKSPVWEINTEEEYHEEKQGA